MICYKSLHLTSLPINLTIALLYKLFQICLRLTSLGPLNLIVSTLIMVLVVNLNQSCVQSQFPHTPILILNVSYLCIQAVMLSKVLYIISLHVVSLFLADHHSLALITLFCIQRAHKCSVINCLCTKRSAGSVFAL